jgi:competence protein ComEA
MFGRRGHPAGDVTAAAQRRLAALAREYGWADRADEVVDDDVLDERPAPGERPPAVDAGSRSTGPGRCGARHAAEPDRGQHGRWSVGLHHVTAMTLGLLVLLALVAWWAIRSVPHDQMTVSATRGTPTAGQPGTRTPSAGPASNAPGADSSAGTDLPAGQVSTPPATSAGAAALLVVDVAGRVRHPGIVELPAGSRVADALAAAGGTVPGVSLTRLNLAQLLVDGEQILVGLRAPVLPPGSGVPSSDPTATQVTRVDLNTATAEQLDTLPDIGPVTAEAILRWRADNGSFSSVDELLDVSGIGDATLADVRPYVYV